MDERKDRRGAPRGDQSKPGGQRRAGTPHEGKMGNLPHVRNEEAAKQIEILSGFALTREQVSQAICTLFTDQGYSPDTLERHYREELNRGKTKAKTALMQGAYDIALGRNTPAGVSPDAAFRERGKKIEFLLSAVHDVVPAQARRLGGPDGGAIPLAHIDLSSLSDDDLDALERLSERLTPPGADQG